MAKVDRRLTQMSYRISSGNGEAFYEVGIMDDGQPLGIEPQQIFETLLVLFHIAEKIGATLSFVLARLGQEDGLYSIKLRVTRPQEEYIDPEIASFVSSLEYLKDKRISYRNNQFGSSS